MKKWFLVLFMIIFSSCGSLPVTVDLPGRDLQLIITSRGDSARLTVVRYGKIYECGVVNPLITLRIRDDRVYNGEIECVETSPSGYLRK